MVVGYVEVATHKVRSDSLAPATFDCANPSQENEKERIQVMLDYLDKTLKQR